MKISAIQVWKKISMEGFRNAPGFEMICAQEKILERNVAVFLRWCYISRSRCIITYYENDRYTFRVPRWCLYHHGRDDAWILRQFISQTQEGFHRPSFLSFKFIRKNISFSCWRISQHWSVLQLTFTIVIPDYHVIIIVGWGDNGGEAGEKNDQWLSCVV